MQKLEMIAEDGGVVWETQPAPRVPMIVPFDEAHTPCGEIPIRIYVDEHTMRLDWLDAATGAPLRR